MEKPKLDIYVSAEASEDEKFSIAESFDDLFEVSLHKGQYRFSEALPPLVITIAIAVTQNPVAVNVASNALWDLLKIAVNRFRNQPKSKINREVIIKIRTQQRELIITKDKFFAQEKMQEKEFSSIEELFDELKNE